MAEPAVRLRGMLGFAMRAGKLLIGTDTVCRAMAKTGRAKPSLTLVSVSASAATKKKIRTKSEFYHIPHAELPIEQAALAALLGKESTPTALAVCDEGFAKEILAALQA